MAPTLTEQILTLATQPNYEQGIMTRQAPKAMKNEGLARNHGKSYDEHSKGIPAIKSEFHTPHACVESAGISGMTVFKG